jgi:hypothetical protein
VSNTFTGEANVATIMHRRLGHVSLANQHLYQQLAAIYGPSFTKALAEFCPSCVLAKMKRQISRLLLAALQRDPLNEFTLM